MGKETELLGKEYDELVMDLMLLLLVRVKNPSFCVIENCGVALQTMEEVRAKNMLQLRLPNIAVDMHKQ